MRIFVIKANETEMVAPLLSKNGEERKIYFVFDNVSTLHNTSIFYLSLLRTSFVDGRNSSISDDS